MSDAYDDGMAVRREVLGDDHVDRATATTTPFAADFQDLITRYAWGGVWTRPGLRPHRRLSVDEIGEVILQAAVYCGVPAANHAFAIAPRGARRGRVRRDRGGQR